MDSYTASFLVDITFHASCLIYRHVLLPVMSIVFSGEARKQHNMNISCRPITPLSSASTDSVFPSSSHGRMVLGSP